MSRSSPDLPDEFFMSSMDHISLKDVRICKVVKWFVVDDRWPAVEVAVAPPHKFAGDRLVLVQRWAYVDSDVLGGRWPGFVRVLDLPDGYDEGTLPTERANYFATAELYLTFQDAYEHRFPPGYRDGANSTG